MKKPYQIMISRRSAALYLAWEYGVARARKILSEAKNDGGFVFLPQERVFMAENGRFTKRAAERYRAHIKQVIGFQEGRLGRALTGGDVYISAANKTN